MLIIRRMQCESCRKIHHELPDVLVSYKRYAAVCIEQVISDVEPIDVAADESTLYHWRKWFEAWASYAVNGLTSIAKRLQLPLPVRNPSDSPQTVLQRMGHNEEKTTAGWLAKAVRPIANAHLWIHTRSAFLSGPP